MVIALNVSLDNSGMHHLLFAEFHAMPMKCLIKLANNANALKLTIELMELAFNAEEIQHLIQRHNHVDAHLDIITEEAFA